MKCRVELAALQSQAQEAEAWKKRALDAEAVIALTESEEHIVKEQIKQEIEEVVSEAKHEAEVLSRAIEIMRENGYAGVDRAIAQARKELEEK